jgi:cytochrome c oxidase subunit I+III
VIFVLRWLWDTDPGPKGEVDIGGGIRLPSYVTGPSSHSWWATVVLLLVAGTCFACLVFSYLFLWTTRPGQFPPPGLALPELSWTAVAAVLYAVSAAAILLASRLLHDVRESGAGSWPVRLALLVTMPLLAGAGLAEFYGQWETGLRAPANSYGATVYGISAFQLFFIATSMLMLLYTLARSLAGKLNGVWRATFDNTMLFCLYTAGQGLAGLLLTHLFPRLIGAAP